MTVYFSMPISNSAGRGRKVVRSIQAKKDP
jgi:hypothetical protein